MCALRWDEQPSSDQTSCIPIPIFRVAKSGKAYVWLLAPFEGLWTHFIRKKTWPCLDKDCPYCDSVAAKWKGYAPALVWLYDAQAKKNGWQPRVVEVTEKLRDLKGRRDLVGQVLHIQRLGVKPNGPLSWELAPDRVQPKGKPPMEAFDIEPSLEALFDLPGRHLRPTATPAAEEQPPGALSIMAMPAEGEADSVTG